METEAGGKIIQHFCDEDENPETVADGYAFCNRAIIVHIADIKETTKEALAKILNEEKDICKAVKNAIQQQLSVKDTVKLYIQMGHDACLVVRCAIQAKGDLEQVITGALEGGASADVCSRCAIEEGAEPDARPARTTGTLKSNRLDPPAAWVGFDSSTH